MQTNQTNAAAPYPRTIAELKKLIKPETEENERWLCAACPHAQFEAVIKSKNDEQNTQILAIMAPLKEIGGWRYAACYCAAKSRYVPGYITLCQAYEDAMQEQAATRLDQSRGRA